MNVCDLKSDGPQHDDQNVQTHEGTNVDRSCGQQDWVSVFAPVHWRHVALQIYI